MNNNIIKKYKQIGEVELVVLNGSKDISKNIDI